MKQSANQESHFVPDGSWLKRESHFCEIPFLREKIAENFGSRIPFLRNPILAGMYCTGINESGKGFCNAMKNSGKHKC